MRTAASSYAACPGPCHLVLPFRRLVVIQDMVLVFLTLTLTLVTGDCQSPVTRSPVNFKVDLIQHSHTNKQVSLVSIRLIVLAWHCCTPLRFPPAHTRTCLCCTLAHHFCSTITLPRKHAQENCLADLIQGALMLRYNKRKVG